MKAMIFCAGLGTRLKPITDTLPKALLPLGGKTLLQYQIEKLKAAGINDIVLNLHHLPMMIVDYLRQNNNFGCHILLSDETDQLLDTGGGLRKAQPLLITTGCQQNEPILALNVDILSNINIQQFISSYSRSDLATLVVSDRKTQRYLLFDENSRLQGWTNIQTGEVRPTDITDKLHLLNHLAFSGMQLLSPQVFQLMDKVVVEKGQKFSLIDLYLSLCQTEKIKAFVPANYRMMDVGKIAQLDEAEQFAQSMYN